MILIGASGHAKVIIDILEKQGVNVEFLIDANPNIKQLDGYTVKGEDCLIESSENEFIISIGSNSIRRTLAHSLNASPGFGTAIHPQSILGKDVSIGKGSVVMGGTIINSATKVGEHAIVNTGASIDHDCRIEDFVHISPQATLCGGIEVGEGAHIGAGAIVIPNITIGRWCEIGAGTVVIKDIPDYAVVVGNPGRIIKYNERG